MCHFERQGDQMSKTLEMMNILQERQQESWPRAHLGASQLGKPCERQLWYGFRQSLQNDHSALTLRRFEDGHRSEALVAEWLSEVVPLTDQQASFRRGHWGGSIDGILPEGPLEHPGIPHIWEHKCVSDKKWDQLEKLLTKLDPTAAMLKWDRVYYSQGQIYMLAMGLEWHWMTVASAGTRKMQAVRTPLDRIFAGELEMRAERIVRAHSAPPRASTDPGAFVCRWCDFKEICHDDAKPEQHCRTCKWSRPDTDLPAFVCQLKNDHLLDVIEEIQGCDSWCRFFD
tara:strand:+ start:7028 stop:7882 length:855 start_codon:yes stop_codon:yes gene_type:complete